MTAASEIGPSHDAVLIALAPSATALADVDSGSISDELLDDIFVQMLDLRAARIAHGAVGPHTIWANTDSNSVTLTDFRNGVSNASDFLLDQDLAGAMASVALVAGTERTVRSVIRVVPSDVLTGALTHLRRAGLDPTITVALKGKKELLDQLRIETAKAANSKAPELVEPRRMSWNQVLVAVGSLIGGWALILVLINASHSISTIRHASWGWVIATLVLCWSAFVGRAVADLGAVPGPLSLARTLGLEVANSFTTLAGGNPAVLATQVRFYQQQGYDASVAVTSSALISAASLLVKVALFLIAIPIALGLVPLR